MKKIFIIFSIIVAVLLGFYLFKSGGIYEGESSTATNDQDFDLTEEYRNEKYSFSFRHPKQFAPVFIEDHTDFSDTVTVFKTGESTMESFPSGFQISIQPFDEDLEKLTVERIKQDLSDLKIEDPQDVILGNYGSGVAFLSDDEGFEGKSREVWFIFRRNLYQIRSHVSYDAFLQKILNTWKFE